MNSSGNNNLKNKAQNKQLLTPLPPQRRLSRCIAALFGVTLASASSLAFSLGLGELSSDSFLGQPLNASIELVSLEGDIDLNTLIIRQVTPDEAARMGVDILYMPYRINFSVVTAGGAPQVSVKSSEPINEPYLSLMVELRWPKGVVYREYPVLLDLPPIVPVREARAEKRPVSVQPAPRPVAASAPSRTRAPVQVQLEPLPTESGKYKVKPGDTLSKIAARWREGTSQSIGDTSQWLFENNSHAFANNDINRLRAGAVLQMPDLSSFRTSEEQGGRTPPSLASLPEQGSGEGRVSTIAPEAGETPVAGRPERVGNDAVQGRDMRGLLTLGTDSRDDKTRELIDMLVRENETLKARMEKVESSEYLETLKQLIVLQRQQISDLRQKLGVPDNDVTQEMDSLLGQIGVPVVESKSADVSISPPTAPLAAVETPTASIIEVEPAITPPVADSERRGWLVWLMFGAAAALSALFIGMFAYYRRMVPGKARREEDDVPVPVRDYSTRSEPTLASYQPRRDAPASTSLDDLDADLTPVYAHKKKNEDNWLGEKVAENNRDVNDLEAAIREVQEAFEDLVLDDDALNNLDGIEELSLEGLTEHLSEEPLLQQPLSQESLSQEPLIQESFEELFLDESLIQEPASNIAPVPAANEKSKKNKKRKQDESNRRPDEEVRMSIAEKMAQYNPDEYRQEIESLSLMELDELLGVEENDEENIDAVVYRAMMFCEFKKFDKARELIEGHMQIERDSRLDAALEQVENLAKEAAQAGAKKAI